MSESAMRAQIELAEKTWMAAAMASSAEKYNTILAEDFLFIMHGGQVLRRQDFLDSVKAGHRKVSAMSFESVEIRFYGEVAVVTGTLKVEAEFNGIPFSGPSRITKVWFRKDGQWKAVSFHASDARVRVSWDNITKR